MTPPPGSARDSTAPASPPEPTLGEDLRMVYYALATRWKLIAMAVALSIAVGIVYMWTAEPAYTSTASILIDPRERNLTDGEIVQSGLGSSSLGADTALVQSQVEMLRSRAVMDRLIEEENLLDDPEFGHSSGGGNPVKTLARLLLYGPNLDSFTPLSPYDAAIAKLYKAVDVDRIGNTYILTVAVKTGSAEKSARLANTIAHIYLEQSQQAANSSTAEAAAALEDRLAGLLEKANAAQNAVERYRSENNLLGVEGVLVDEQQLRNLNEQVTVASIEAERARARLDELRRLSSLPTAEIAESNILSSPLTERLRAEIAIVRAQEDIMHRTYGNRHPHLQNAAQNRATLEQALAAEFRRILGRAESEFQSAAAREQALRAMLVNHEQRQSELNTASIRLRQLEQVASSNRAVYETFLQRSNEARQQIDLPTVTARVISNAVPSSRPSDPQLRIVMMIALLGGLMAGLALAWLLHLLQGTRDEQRPQPFHGRRRLPQIDWRRFIPARRKASKQPRPAVAQRATADDGRAHAPRRRTGSLLGELS